MAPDTAQNAGQDRVTDSAAPRCTYYQGCTEPAKSCGYCTTHCLCGAGERFDQLLADEGFGAAWDNARHDAPFGHCAKCRREVPVSTGADGAVIVSMGYCPDCKITTMWEAVDGA